MLDLVGMVDDNLQTPVAFVDLDRITDTAVLVRTAAPESQLTYALKPTLSSSAATTTGFVAATIPVRRRSWRWWVWGRPGAGTGTSPAHTAAKNEMMKSYGSETANTTYPASAPR